MGEWLKGRRNALIDAVLVYLAFEWIVPCTVSVVAYLSSSTAGVSALFVIAYLAFVGTVIYLAATAELPAERAEDGDDDSDWEWVYVRGYRPAPWMVGGLGTWVRVRPRQEADAA